MRNALVRRDNRVLTGSILGISAAMLVSLAVAVPTGAATRYVNVSNASPGPPYTTWATAANVIQDAVDVAQPGDEIVVTNGVYESGGRVAHGTLANRVAVTKPLTLRSVNGPDVTVIRGYQVPGTTNGNTAVRCVYLANGATLVGFTLTGGATRTNEDNSLPSSATGGGVWCESRSAILSNCVLSSNIAYFQGGGAYRGTLNNCRLLNNRASGILFPDPDFGPGAAAGGGACDAELNSCVLSNNMADHGGGASLSTLNQCTMVGNRATVHGGGSGGVPIRNSDFFGTLNHCLVVSNVAGGSGGGIDNARVRNCVIARNTAGDFGGGAMSATLENCVLFANRAWVGGGVFLGDLNNCTLTGNSASMRGGGAVGGPDWVSHPDNQVRLNNCIVYSNNAPDGPNWANWSSQTGDGVVFMNSCTTPLPTHGVSNIIGAPLFVDPAAENFHLQPTSPCINAGLNAYAPDGPDLDGNPRILGGRVDMGAYEFQAALRYVNVNNTNPSPPYTTWATAANVIQDAIDIAQPGDEIVVTDGVYAAGGRAVHGTLINIVAVTKPLTLRSVNGPDVTMIHGVFSGETSMRCVYLASGATLIGFTLTGGGTGWSDDDRVGSGGGVWCESRTATLLNCIVSGNAAFFRGGGVYRGVLNNCKLLNNHAYGSVGENQGGGAVDAELNNCVLSNNVADHYGGALECTLNGCTLVSNRSWSEAGGAGFSTLNNCVVVSNVCHANGGGAFISQLRNCVIAHNTANFGNGGGAWGGTLNNCTVAGNSASSSGGGVAGGYYSEPPRLNNCIVYSNTAPSGANWATFPTDAVVFNNSCTTPLPPHGIGNVSNAPLFVNPATGNFRLQPNSPCINAGLNAYAPVGPDLDSHPRIAGGAVDMGAYEFQSPRSMISHAWLQQFGLSTDGSMDVADADRDGLNTLQEWRAGTNPTNSLSVLRLLTPIANTSGLQVRWQSVSNRTYFLERSSNPIGQQAFAPLAAYITGRPNVTTYEDTNAAGSAKFFYRVGVRD